MKRVNRVGERTQPCGVPVFKVRGDEILDAIFTTCSRSKRKSKIQLQSETGSLMPAIHLFNFQLSTLLLQQNQLKGLVYSGHATVFRRHFHVERCCGDLLNEIQHVEFWSNMLKELNGISQSQRDLDDDVTG